MLLDEATEDGLRGASFFAARRLSKPFSRGEWAGLPLGDVGSWGRWTRCEQNHEPSGPCPKRRSASYLVGDVHHQIVVALLAIALLRKGRKHASFTRSLPDLMEWPKNGGRKGLSRFHVRSASMLAPCRRSSVSCCRRRNRLKTCASPHPENWPRETRRSSGRDRRKEQKNWKISNARRITTKISLSLSLSLS